LSRALLVVLTLGATAAWSQSPRAISEANDGGEAAAKPSHVIVALTFVGDREDRVAFTRSLNELLLRLNVDLAPRITDAPLPRDRLVAEVGADWSVPTEATITIVDAEQRVVLVRRLSRGGSAQVVIEAAAHITQSVIEELVSPSVVRHPLAADEVSPPPSLTATMKEPGLIGVEIAGFFGGRAQGSSAPVGFGGGITAEVSLSTWELRPAIWLSGAYQAPLHARGRPPSESVDFSVQSLALRIGPKITAYSGRSFRLDTGLGAGSDVFFTTVHVGNQSSDRATRTEATGVLTALVSAHFAVARSADVWLGLTVDLDLRPRKYVIGGEPLFEAFPVRPALMLGFSFSAAGAEPYEARLGAAR
jgi:hypothetical protein